MTAPILSSNVAEVILSEDKADENALELSWSASGTSEGGEDISYELYINLSSKDIFTNPQKIDVGSSLKHDFTHAELNGAALDLGAAAGVETELQFAVYAIDASGEYESVISNKIVVTVTAYEKAFAAPSSLIMVGVATPYGWDLSKGLEILETSEGSKVYQAENVPLTVLPESLNAGFKFYFSRSESETDDSRFAGQDYDSDTFGKIEVYDGEGDYQFLPAKNGYDNGLYNIRVDFNTMMMTMERTGDLPELELPDNLYMLGDCFTWKWDWTGTTLDKVSDKIYEAKDVTMSFGEGGVCGFKIFIGYQVWSPYFAMTEDSTRDNIGLLQVSDSEAPQVYPGKIGYSDGVYDVTVNFNDMTITLTLKDEPVDPNEGAMSMLGAASPGGWDERTIIPKKNDDEWEVTGVYLNLKSGDTDNGFKIYPSADGWWPYYGQMASDEEFGTMISVPDQESVDQWGDPTFYPSKYGYESGTYTININTSTMKLTLTKEN